jgi:urea transport system substrate-binding protein
VATTPVKVEPKPAKSIPDFCRVTLRVPSAPTKAVLPVFEQYNGMLYYPTFYEGLEQSKNVIYTGQEATQQILAGLNWVTKEKGAKTFYLLGSD